MATSSTTTAYAIPIDCALAIARQIAAGAESATVHIGEHGLLGVQVDGTVDFGVAVVGVQSGSAAAGAGIANGDTITAVDGKNVDSSTALSAALSSTHVGDTICGQLAGHNRRRAHRGRDADDGRGLHASRNGSHTLDVTDAPRGPAASARRSARVGLEHRPRCRERRPTRRGRDDAERQARAALVTTRRECCVAAEPSVTMGPVAPFAVTRNMAVHRRRRGIHGQVQVDGVGTGHAQRRDRAGGRALPPPP